MIDGTTVIDFHGHVGSWDSVGMIDNPTIMLQAMDSVSIAKSCVFNIFHPDGTTSNNATAAFVAKHPDRFIGFAYVSPIMPDRMLPELERSIDQLKLAAIKLYPHYTPFPLNDSIWYPIYEFANERELTIITHTGQEPTAAPKFLIDIALRFPKAIFVAGHAGNIEPYRSQAIKAAQSCPNVYLETCSSFRSPGVIERLVMEAGADRVIFGSDTPLMDPRCQIGKILTAKISDQEKRLIIGENACRILKL